MSPHLRLLFLTIALLLIAPAAAPATVLPVPHLTGFAAASGSAELERELEVDRTLRPDTLRRHLRILTAVPHVAGTPGDRATA